VEMLKKKEILKEENGHAKMVSGFCKKFCKKFVIEKGVKINEFDNNP
jgi:hypothetical protein